MATNQVSSEAVVVLPYEDDGKEGKTKILEAVPCEDDYILESFPCEDGEG